jgi:DNA-binding protein H-NS
MDKHGLTTADIDARSGGALKRRRKPGAASEAEKTVSEAKYRDPKTGATWTGHGRAPAWIASAKDRSKYLVTAGASASAPAARKTAKSGNYVRGVQPALYADPKTGATWSGRGRAPAWIAGARDRSKFLIAEKGADKAEMNAVGEKASTVKKAATKQAKPGKRRRRRRRLQRKARLGGQQPGRRWSRRQRRRPSPGRRPLAGPQAILLPPWVQKAVARRLRRD